MNLIRDFILVLLLASITGSILMALWLAVIQSVAKKRNVHYVWWMLKGILIGYLVPAVYLAVQRLLQIIRDYGTTLSESNQQMDRLYLVLFLIWVAGVLFFLLFQLSIWSCFWKIKKYSMAVPRQYFQILQKLCVEMKIHRSVSLYQGYGVVSPFIFGMRNPRIYLPVKNFSVGELEMILYHELVHYQQGDTFWKPLFGFLGNIYWFNPAFRYLWKEAVRWTEANCDAYCCESKFQAKKYFTLLLKMASNGQSPLNGYAPMWMEGSRELEWRVKCMKRNQMKKPSSIVIAVIVMVSILSGGISAHAAAGSIERVYYNTYWDTVEETEETLEDGNELKEFEGTMKEFEGMEVIEDSSGQQIAARSASGNIEWTVGNKTIYYTGGFKANSGGKIAVAVGIAPNDKTVKVGILKPDKTVTYVKGTKYISHTFNVSKTGTYKVFVSNDSGKKVTVDGFYSYIK